VFQAIRNAREVNRQSTFEIDDYWLRHRFLRLVDPDPGVEPQATDEKAISCHRCCCQLFRVAGWRSWRMGSRQNWPRHLTHEEFRW